MLDASVLRQISDERLFAVHDGLHSLHDSGQEVVKTFEPVVKEMVRRGLVVKALSTHTTVPGKSAVTSSETKRGRRALGGVAGPGGTDEDLEGADEDEEDTHCTVKKDGADKCSNFTPVRDVCRNCKQPNAAHKEVVKGFYRIDKGLISRAGGALMRGVEDAESMRLGLPDIHDHSKGMLANLGNKIKAGAQRAESMRADRAVSDVLGGAASAGAALTGTPSLAARPTNDPDRKAKLDRILDSKAAVDEPGAGVTDGTGKRRGAVPGHPFNGNQFTKTDYSVDQRQSMAEKGQAMADGSFPIANEADLHHAVRLVGQGSDPQAAMQHIIERAKAMGMEEALPEGWLAQEKEDAKPEPNPGAHGMANENPAPAPTKPVKKSLMQRIADGVVKALDGEITETEFHGTTIDLENDFSYAVVKSVTDKRRTLGPVYMPDTIDAHGEWASASDLEEATVNYVKSGDRTIYLQHSDIPAGEWYGVMPWPFEETARMTVVDGGVKKAAETTFPPGTVYMGIEWEPWAWDEIKSGRLGGLSMGGTARRVEGVPA